MAKSLFKNVAAAARQTPEEMLATARLADSAAPSVTRQTEPAAPEVLAARPSPQVVGLNLKVLLGTSMAVAEAARERNVSMKTVVMDALAAAGIAVEALDREDRTPARRKGR